MSIGKEQAFVVLDYASGKVTSSSTPPDNAESHDGTPESATAAPVAKDKGELAKLIFDFGKSTSKAVSATPQKLRRSAAKEKPLLKSVADNDSDAVFSIITDLKQQSGFEVVAALVLAAGLRLIDIFNAIFQMRSATGWPLEALDVIVAHAKESKVVGTVVRARPDLSRCQLRNRLLAAARSDEVEIVRVLCNFRTLLTYEDISDALDVTGDNDDVRILLAKRYFDSGTHLRRIVRFNAKEVTVEKVSDIPAELAVKFLGGQQLREYLEKHPKGHDVVDILARSGRRRAFQEHTERDDFRKPRRTFMLALVYGHWEVAACIVRHPTFSSSFKDYELSQLCKERTKMSAPCNWNNVAGVLGLLVVVIELLSWTLR